MPEALCLLPMSSSQDSTPKQPIPKIAAAQNVILQQATGTQGDMENFHSALQLCIEYLLCAGL